MIKKYYAVFGPALRVLDALILSGTWILAYYLRRHFPLKIMTNGLPPFEYYVGFVVFILLLWQTVFSVSNIYSSKRLIRRIVEAYQVLRAHALSLLIFVSLTYLFSTFRLSRGVFFYFGLMSSVLLVGVRLLLRHRLRSLRVRGLNQRVVVIAGVEKLACDTYRRLRRHPELGLKFVGFVGQGQGSVEGLPLLGDFSQVRDVLRQVQAQKLVIALSHQETPQLDSILKSLKDEVIDLILIPDIHEYVTLGCEVEDFDGIPMVSLNETPMYGFNILLKRVFDIFVASTTLLLCAPLMILVAIIIKLTSAGPIFYKQERMSLNGRRFYMLKFRSMTTVQAGDVELLTKKNDPRVTVIGKIIRSMSLDELPQIFNVLKGDMSLVGPRPERTWVVEELRDKIPSYMLKHKVKAGITGWAQVNGWRGDTSLEKRIEYDLYYIRNWSLLFDIKIMLLTFIKGFMNRNAY